MTTIATDGITIAADGQATGSYGVIGSRTARKIIVRDGRIYALTGSMAILEPLAKWHADGADPFKVPPYHGDGGWTLLVISRDGMQCYSSDAPHPFAPEPPCAFGAGSEMALGAMDAGADPRRAIEIVSRRTNHTGGEIQVVDINTALAGHHSYGICNHVPGDYVGT